MSGSFDRGRSPLVANYAQDRMIFLLIAFVLTVFGMLMIYSASSIMALTSEATGHNPAYYVIRQLLFGGAGTILAVVIARSDYHLWSQKFKMVLWVAVVASLILVLTPVAGQDAYGATRWIKIGQFTLQPSEFAKGVLLVVAADLVEGYVRDGDASLTEYAKRAAVLIGLPLVMVLFQPDKGTVITVGATFLLLLYLAGVPKQLVGGCIVAGVGFILFMSLKDEYSRSRVMTMLDPWRDPYGDGYQIIQGLYAFGSGGIFGVGLGNSRQKYSYLPMAHNDFIFAVIGEELGLVGTLLVLVLFLALVYFGFKIARSAPDLSGSLIAAGSVMMLGIQMLINVCGVLKVIPLSGKPIPFLSYGGSSIMSTLILVGLVASVSRTAQGSSSSQSGFVVHEGGVSRGFTVIEGGAQTSPNSLRSSREERDRIPEGGKLSYNSNGTRRITLGPSASDRLRSRDERRSGRG